MPPVLLWLGLCSFNSGLTGPFEVIVTPILLCGRHFQLKKYRPFLHRISITIEQYGPRKIKETKSVGTFFSYMHFYDEMFKKPWFWANVCMCWNVGACSRNSSRLFVNIYIFESECKKYCSPLSSYAKAQHKLCLSFARLRRRPRSVIVLTCVTVNFGYGNFTPCTPSPNIASKRNKERDSELNLNVNVCNDRLFAV